MPCSMSKRGRRGEFYKFCQRKTIHQILEIAHLKNVRATGSITYKNDYHTEIESIIESVMPSKVGRIEEDGAHV